jgi:hypothetical protein
MIVSAERGATGGAMGQPERFLTAKSIQRHRKGCDPEWVPEALDWPLPAKLHGDKLEQLRQQIVEYLYAITWGQPKGSRAQLRREIMRASRRLYEVAVLVQAEYQGFVDFVDDQREAGIWAPRKASVEKEDPDIPF